MFYAVSKLFWAFAAPSRAVGLVMALGCILMMARMQRAGLFLVLLGCALFGAMSFLPVGNLLLRPLEDRFARPNPAPDQIAGFIILGGTIDESLSNGRDEVLFSSDGGRIAEAARLARLYPNARIVFTGGPDLSSVNLFSESDYGKRFLVEMGVDANRIELERASRNTWENAVFTRDQVKPQSDERWLLLTSAYHMPRAMGIFRQVGFPVIAWPVDYKTIGNEEDFRRPHRPGARALDTVDTAMSEWIGLLAYRLAGRSQALFPAP